MDVEALPLNRVGDKAWREKTEEEMNLEENPKKANIQKTVEELTTEDDKKAVNENTVEALHTEEDNKEKSVRT